MSSPDYRLSYHEARELLGRRLAERAAGRIQLLAGPRQVGKTTLLRRPYRPKDAPSFSSTRRTCFMTGLDA